MTETPVPADSEPQSIDDVLAEEVPAEAAASDGGQRPSALDIRKANSLAAERRPTVVVLAGAVGSGKTSIYAAIYERLGRGPFAGWIFAGSRTIPGLEERCHSWRKESGREVPFMEHTRSESLPWIHIRLRDAQRRMPARDLLLGDFDGEIFEAVLQNRTKANELPYLRRADHVGVVIDGAKVADPTRRAAERQQAQYLLEALLSGNALAGPDAVSLIISKMDLMEDLQPSDRADVEQWLEDLNRFANALTGLTVPLLRLAVRSENSLFPLGHGLETFLELLSFRPALQIGAHADKHVSSSPLGKFRA